MLTRGGEEVKSREMMKGGKGVGERSEEVKSEDVEQQCQRSV